MSNTGSPNEKEARNYSSSLSEVTQKLETQHKLIEQLYQLINNQNRQIVTLHAKIEELQRQLSQLTLQNYRLLKMLEERNLLSKEDDPSIISVLKTSNSDMLEKRRYQVVAGDTLSGIAKKFGVSLQKLKEVNQLSSETIRVGQWLIIPTN